MNQGRLMMMVIGISMLVSIGFLCIVNPMAPKAQEPKRFEYRIVEALPDTMNMQTKLNEFGMSGWELVAVSMGNMTEPRLIFKKQCQFSRCCRPSAGSAACGRLSASPSGSMRLNHRRTERAPAVSVNDNIS